MGRNNRAKKKKPGMKPDQKIMRKEYDRMRHRVKEEISQDFIQIMYPISEQTAFLQLVYLAMITAKDKFGFGKERLSRLANGIINQYECVLTGHVTIREMIDYVHEITGLKFEMTEEETRILTDMQIEKIERSKHGRETDAVAAV